MTSAESADGAPADGVRTDGAPAVLDLVAYLTDADAELARCAAQHWWAQAIGMNAAPMPVVLSHDAVRTVLRDPRACPRSFTDDMVTSGVSQRTAEQLTPLFRRNGDEHRRYRALLSAAFTPKSVEKLRPATAAIAARLAAEIPAGEPVDVVAAFAAPLPAEVFAALFGFPATDRDRLARWGTLVAQAFTIAIGAGHLDEVERAATELWDYCAAIIGERRASPADDLITHLLDVEVDGERLGHDDVVSVMSAFIFAGSETTKRQLTQIVAALAEAPAVWERLAAWAAAHPSGAPIDAGGVDLVANTVEEVLRHRPIVPGLTRVVDEPMTLGDLAIGVGGRLMVSMTTANHDPARFTDPEGLDIDRPNAAEHLTFGWGLHYCVGAGLARMEMAESLRALLAAFGPPTVVVAGASSGLAAPDELVVTFPRRAPA